MTGAGHGGDGMNESSAHADSEAPTPMPDWARDPETLEQVFMAAVGKGDAQGVEVALRLMLRCDPRRAIRLYESLELALFLAGQQ